MVLDPCIDRFWWWMRTLMKRIELNTEWFAIWVHDAASWLSLLGTCYLRSGTNGDRVGSPLGCDHRHTQLTWEPVPTIWTHFLGVYSIQNPFHLRQVFYHGWIKCRPRNSNRMLQIPPYSHTRAEGESHARISRSICAAPGSDFGNAKRRKAAAYTIGTD